MEICRGLGGEGSKGLVMYMYFVLINKNIYVWCFI